MSLILVRVQNASDPEKEYVVLKATAAMNLKGYAIVDRTFDEEDLSNEFRHIFFFPNWKVEKDDTVYLNTRKGKNIERWKSSEGNYFHSLFWQSDICIWNDGGGDRATLISYETIKTVIVPAVEK